MFINDCIKLFMFLVILLPIYEQIFEVLTNARKQYKYTHYKCHLIAHIEHKNACWTIHRFGRIMSFCRSIIWLKQFHSKWL